jgi:flagellar biosynthetic protein FliR
MSVAEIAGKLLGVPPAAAIVVFAAALARLAPILWLAPFPGGRLVPALVKVPLALLLTLLVYPQLAPAATKIAAGGLPLVLAVIVKEALIGAALGFLVALVFHAAASAGFLADTARGATNSQVLVPQTGAKSTALGALFFQLTLVLFISLGGHRLLLMAIGSSYQALPIDVFPSTRSLGAFALLCASLTGELILLAVSLAAPVIAALLLADLALGWVNRFAPQLNVFFLAMPAKALLGVAVLVLAIGAVAAALPTSLEAGLAQLERAMGLLRAP